MRDTNRYITLCHNKGHYVRVKFIKLNLNTHKSIIKILDMNIV